MEFPNNNFLDIDYLKNNQKRLYYFGLGFIQLVLNENERIHFYSTRIPIITEDVHNHRYNFKSTILKGQLIEATFDLHPMEEGNEFILTNESCGKDKVLVYQPEIEIGLSLRGKEKYNEGEHYERFFNEFHTVMPFGDTITHLVRGPIITDYAQVVTRKNKEKVCPFSIEYSDRVLWEIIEETIKS